MSEPLHSHELSTTASELQERLTEFTASSTPVREELLHDISTHIHQHATGPILEEITNPLVNPRLEDHSYSNPKSK